MQQPPPGRPPGPPYRPPQGQPPRTAPPPPPSYSAPVHPPQAPGNTPGYGAPAVPPPGVLAMPRRKKRGALRFVAASCVFSAWLTLIFSLIFAGGSFLGGAAAMRLPKSPAASSSMPGSMPIPSLPAPGSTANAPGLEGDDLGVGSMPFGGSPLGGSPLGGNPLGGGPFDLIREFLPAISFASGAFTLVTGIVGFVLFLGMAQACYALMDLEDQTFQMAQTLQMIVNRLGPGR